MRNGTNSYTHERGGATIVADIVNTIRISNQTGKIADLKEDHPEGVFDMHTYVLFLKSHARRHTFKLTSDRLTALGAFLKAKYLQSIDPIEYLAFLYYEDGLSMRDISSRLNESGIDFPHRTLSQLLVESFGWQLRDHNEGTRITEKKNRSKKTLHSINSQRTEMILQQTQILTNSILSVADMFSEEDFFAIHLLKNVEEKIVFLISRLGIAQDPQGLASYFTKLTESGYSLRTIAKIVQNSFDECYGKHGGKPPIIKTDYLSNIIQKGSGKNECNITCGISCGSHGASDSGRAYRPVS